MQRCKSLASRYALARLLAASEDSVGTSASASGSSEAPSGSGGGVPSSAAAARREGSTLRWLGHVSADAEGEPPSKRMLPLFCMETPRALFGAFSSREGLNSWGTAGRAPSTTRPITVGANCTAQALSVFVAMFGSRGANASSWSTSSHHHHRACAGVVGILSNLSGICRTLWGCASIAR